MPYTPRGYRRLKNGLLKKSTTTTKRRRKRKQKGKGHSKTQAQVLRNVNSALKKVNAAKKIFGKSIVDKAVKQLKKKRVV